MIDRFVHNLSGSKQEATGQIDFADKVLKGLLDEIDDNDLTTVHQIKGAILNCINNLEVLKG